jgi:hypothetical protein
MGAGALAIPLLAATEIAGDQGVSFPRSLWIRLRKKLGPGQIFLSADQLLRFAYFLGYYLSA